MLQGPGLLATYYNSMASVVLRFWSVSIHR